MRTSALLPCEVVLTDRNGNIQHFYKRDEEEYFQKRAIEERQAKDLSKDPQSDTYAVQADAGGNLAPLYVGHLHFKSKLTFT
jgi:hypothetical protein